MRRVACLLTVLAALVPAASAGADDVVAELPHDTPIGAYGGALAWSSFDAAANGYRLIVTTGGGAHLAAPIPPSPRPFDVSLGPDAANRPVALYTRCTTSCDIYRYDVAKRSERRLGFSSPREDEAWPAQWGARVAFVRRGPRVGTGGPTDCDVPFVKTISSATPPRRLDRGSCGSTTGMSIRREQIIQVTFGSPPDASRYQSQVRRLSARGGAVRVLARQGSGEESNTFSSPNQSASAVWVTRSGEHPAPAFVRIDPRSGRTREVHALTQLMGPLARDERGSFYYVEGERFGGYECRAVSLVPCRIVHTAIDPFSARLRALLPTLTIRGPRTGDPPAVMFGDPFVLSGRLTRTIVSAGKVVRRAPLAGVRIELLRHDGYAPQPTGVRITTAADGRWSYTVPDPGPNPAFTAIARSRSQPPTHAPGVAHATVEARITLTVSGTTFGGTVTPAQPGRTVRIQRLVRRRCKTEADGRRLCAKAWSTVALAPLSGAGTTFSATVAAPQAGRYRAVLPQAKTGGDPNAYSGTSARIAVGG